MGLAQGGKLSTNWWATHPNGRPSIDELPRGVLMKATVARAAAFISARAGSATGPSTGDRTGEAAPPASSRPLRQHGAGARHARDGDRPALRQVAWIASSPHA